MKNALTFTLIAGTMKCPNNCPICISKMTPSNDIGYEKIPINVDCLRQSIQIALNHNARNVLITSKGEATLYPEQVSQYLIELRGKPFDKIELQTEGSFIGTTFYMDSWLETWRHLGLNMVSISIYHYDCEKNSKMFKPDARSRKGYQLGGLIATLHQMGYGVRLSCSLVNGFIDSMDEVQTLIKFAKGSGVEQLSLRHIDSPKGSERLEISKNVDKYKLPDAKISAIKNYVTTHGIFCDALPHGAKIYEVKGQNVCLTSGISDDAGSEELRQLIFFPQGILTSSWVSVNGSRLL